MPMTRRRCQDGSEVTVTTPRRQAEWRDHEGGQRQQSLLNSKIEAIYASMRDAGKMIMQESPASTKPSTDDTRGSQPVSVLRVCCSDPKRLSLAGSYRAFGQLYGRPSFRKAGSTISTIGRSRMILSYVAGGSVTQMAF
ncbi:adck1 [Symbiodinium sp. KB8]|nr:adck1 [Symbiodinium sp. KB8]